MSSEPVGFRDLGVSDEVVQALAERGILIPFPIQSMVWEDARAGRDTLARSKTGSGKTLGFAIPIAERLDPDAQPLPAALVLVPTRELAQQVREDFEVGGYDRAVVEEADHRFISVPPHEKLAKLTELATAEGGLTLVFVNTKRAVDDLARRLKAEGVPALALHGDMRQEARDRSLKRFEDGHVGVLVATDVAARGLDLDDITLVVNYDAPLDDKSYVHRVGRTARAGRAGTSVTFVTPQQQGDISRMAARLDLHAEFELEGMKVVPPRTVFKGGPKGRRSAFRPPKRT